MTGNLPIDICVCTFRRAHLANTLRSIAVIEQRPDWKLRIIVADNDDTPSAQALVESTAQENGLNITYIHAPARNISLARNACLDAATAPYVAFIDDDELISPQWLKALMLEMESSKADAVLGPVKAVYAPDCPAWIRNGDYHSTAPVWVKGEIITGYAGNVLLRRDAPGLQNLRFRLDLGRSGGEDTVFFSTLHRYGSHISYAPDALATEAVPPERATLRWLLTRRFRTGQTHGLLLLDQNRCKCSMSIAGVKAAYCLLMALCNMFSPERMRFWLLRGSMHGGVVARLAGKHEIEPYHTEHHA